jgi:hypothetical protein
MNFSDLFIFVEAPTSLIEITMKVSIATIPVIINANEF